MAMEHFYGQDLQVMEVSGIFEPHQYPEIKAFYMTHGFVLIQLLDERACKNAIKEQVEKILLRQPWEERLVVLDPRTKGEIVYSPETSDAYVDALVRPNIPSRVLKGYQDAWPFHRGFGACCDPAAFHLYTVWSIRENQDIVCTAANLLDCRPEDLWVDINRSIHKLPTEGDDEFLHWDLQKFGKYQPDTSVQGKVMYSTGQFVCVPKSHTLDFHSRFNQHYAPLYPEIVGREKAMTNLDLKKPDPLNLKGQTCIFRIPPGCCVFWSTNLLHGQKKTPRNAEPEFGMYLGYMKKAFCYDRPEYRDKAERIKERDIEQYGQVSQFWGRPTSEREDRIYSYEHGVAPFLWPSLQPISFYPRKFYNFGEILGKYVGRTRPDALQKYLLVREGTNGWAYDFLPWENTGYVPYPLSPLGRSLLS